MTTANNDNLLDDLLDTESGLTGWEMDFIEPLDKQRDQTWTEKQTDKVSAIWQRIFG